MVETAGLLPAWNIVCLLSFTMVLLSVIVPTHCASAPMFAYTYTHLIWDPAVYVAPTPVCAISSLPTIVA